MILIKTFNIKENNCALIIPVVFYNTKENKFYFINSWKEKEDKKNKYNLKINIGPKNIYCRYKYIDFDNRYKLSEKKIKQMGEIIYLSTLADSDREEYGKVKNSEKIYEMYEYFQKKGNDINIFNELSRFEYGKEMICSGQKRFEELSHIYNKYFNLFTCYINKWGVCESLSQLFAFATLSIGLDPKIEFIDNKGYGINHFFNIIGTKKYDVTFGNIIENFKKSNSITINKY